MPAVARDRGARTPPTAFAVCRCSRLMRSVPARGGQMMVASAAFGLLLAACGGVGDPVPPPTSPIGALPTGYTAYVTGTPNATASPAGGVYLAGGGTDDAVGMAWLLAQGGVAGITRGGQPYFGDVVVLRTSGSDGYNSFLERLGANSVATYVITSTEGANSDSVAAAIARAEVLFLAGGDQSTYVNRWTGTRLQRAVNTRVAQGYPIGGTSAGLNVLAGHIYSAQLTSTTSGVALANPYDRSITFAKDLFDVPLLANVIAEPHFVTRDRMGRLYTFLARLQADDGARAPRGLAVDEGSAVGLAANHRATVFGAGGGVYLLTPPPSPRGTLSAPLTYHAMTVARVPIGGTFDAASWTAPGPVYSVTARAGVLTSSNGVMY
ncbi:cyanophycinase [Gemmatimonas sp.]|uniref:cyanophycinase n=1 Tax=Gemmatimonas sp. TaxID=1962908 RepID=UPI0022BF6DB9|nr:cyanophycinase [Gemmatimonas sp.]MCZ8205816.1 cyanophycinase [Gemmatimonas sp.]